MTAVEKMTQAKWKADGVAAQMLGAGFMAFAAASNDEARCEIFENRIKKYIDLNAEWEGKYKTAKAEAIKEFAERLKKCLKKRTEYDEGGWDVDLFTVTEEDIDSLVKEMTEAINNAENDTD